jgi:hypothetical protein
MTAAPGRALMKGPAQRSLMRRQASHASQGQHAQGARAAVTGYRLANSGGRQHHRALIRYGSCQDASLRRIFAADLDAGARARMPARLLRRRWRRVRTKQSCTAVERTRVRRATTRRYRSSPALPLRELFRRGTPGGLRIRRRARARAPQRAPASGARSGRPCAAPRPRLAAEARAGAAPPCSCSAASSHSAPACSCEAAAATWCAPPGACSPPRQLRGCSTQVWGPMRGARGRCKRLQLVEGLQGPLRRRRRTRERAGQSRRRCLKTAAACCLRCGFRRLMEWPTTCSARAPALRDRRCEADAQRLA